MAQLVAWQKPSLPGKNEVVGSNPWRCVTFLAENIAVLSGRLVFKWLPTNIFITPTIPRKIKKTSPLGSYTPWEYSEGITRRERLKSALCLRLEKRKVFRIYSTRLLCKIYKKVSKHSKGVFRARKTLRKFGYSVLRQMRTSVPKSPLNH